MIISLISPQSHYLTPTHASAVLIVLLHSLSRPSFPKHTSCFAMMITLPPPAPLLLLATPAPAPAAAATAAATAATAAGYPHVSIQTVLTHAVHCLCQFLI